MPAPAGFSVKLKTFGLGGAELLAEGCAEADGEAVAAWSPPQAVAPKRIRPTAIPHSALGIPVQVTGAGRGFIPGPVPCLRVMRDAQPVRCGGVRASRGSRTGATRGA